MLYHVVFKCFIRTICDISLLDIGDTDTWLRFQGLYKIMNMLEDYDSNDDHDFVPKEDDDLTQEMNSNSDSKK